MKTATTILMAAMVSMVTALGEAQVGKPAPDFTATDIQGKTHKLSDYRGKVVVLEAYNYDCPYCANHFNSGAAQELQAELAAKGVVWLLVNSSHKSSGSYRDAAAARKEWDKLKIKATAWLDDHEGKVGRLYGMRTTPHLFVIDPKGVLVYAGAMDDRAASEGDPRKAKARNYVREAVTEVLAGKPVTVSQTKPYGCGVKYGR